MTLVAIRYGAIIRCAADDCDRQFVTYSLYSMARVQAAAAAWERPLFVHLFNKPYYSSRRVDACPEHAKIAAANKEKRAADRAARKADRAKRRERALKPASEPTSKAENCCEHGDHPAPAGARFCSDPCQRCEGTEAPPGKECAEICIEKATPETQIAVQLEPRNEGDNLSNGLPVIKIAPTEAPSAARAPRARKNADAPTMLDVIAQIMAEHPLRALSAHDVVTLANGRLPTNSKTPHTVVSRDLALDVKRHGIADYVSRFERVAAGRFQLRKKDPT